VSSEDIPDSLRDAPPATKFVYRELSTSDKMLTTREIAEQTYLHERTVRRSLDRLLEADVVDSEPDPNRPDRPQYRSTECPTRED